MWGFGSATVAAVGSSCSSPTAKVTGNTATAGVDFSSRFSGFTAADEPNGDLSKVDWPAFVTDGGADIKALYEFQITHGEIMRFMPCFCGCGQDAGHHNNRDCYVQTVDADGSVVLDSMAPT